VGQVLARMHSAVADFGLAQPNLRGLPWCLDIAPRLQPF
jgi:homoserine kinase type II